MIPVEPPPEPPDFDARCRRKGQQWLQDNPRATRGRDKKLPSHWTEFRPELAKGFNGLCGYAAMIIVPQDDAEVDHYLSVKNREDLAYEWSNYRNACGLMNNAKKSLDDKVLDPFVAGHGWFQVSLPDLQLRLTDEVPPDERARAEFTLKKLKLRDGEAVLRWRQSFFELYLSGDLSLKMLKRWAPLIAEAVEREGIQPQVKT